MSNSRTKNVIYNMGSSMVVRILTIIVSFVMKTVFIKILGIQYTGVSSLFTDILSVLSFAELGIGTAITFALYKPVAEHDKYKVACLMNFYRLAYRVVALAVFIGGCILIPFLDCFVNGTPDVKEDIRIIYFLYLVNTASSYLLIYKSAILVAKQKKFVISRIEGIMVITRLILECVILVMFRKFLLYLLTEIVMTMLQNFLIALNANKEYESAGIAKERKLSKEERKMIFSDIGALAMYQVSGVVLQGTDSIIISSIIGTSQVGYLSYYKMVINQITSILQQFFSSANASIGNLAIEGENRKQYTLYYGIEFVVFWLMNIVCSCLYIVFNPFIEVWLGKEYILNQWIILALILDLFVSSMTRVISMFRTANGLFTQGKYRPVIMTILNITLSLLLAQVWGVLGVLIATVISRLLTQIWYDPWVVYKNIFHKKVKTYYIRYLLYVGTTFISTISIWIICRFINISNSFWNFVIKLSISFVIANVYIILLWSKTAAFNECVTRINNIFILFRKGEQNGK